MNTQHFQYIVEIERTRSISQAAKNLYLSQPNLSRVLHELEEQLGFAIFERTSRGVMPRIAGRCFSSMPGVFSWRWRALKPWSYTFTEMERQLLRRILTQMKGERVVSK